jgi:hypothetical protein
VRTGEGVEFGPCNIEEVRLLVKQGRIKATTMVFKQSTGRWHLGASVPEIRAFLRMYSPDQDSVLNKIRSLKNNTRDSAHVARELGRVSTIRAKPTDFWGKVSALKKFFGKK